MRVKVRGGTVQHGQPSLCLTCRTATIVKGPARRDRRVLKPEDRYAMASDWD